MSMSFYKWLLISLIAFVPLYSFAAVPVWQIIPNESSITFSGIQNNAPASGKFKQFTGEIAFDPAQLSLSHVRIVIDMLSVATSYNDLTTTLMSDDWFNVKMFPQAIFTANHFVKQGKDAYEAEGALTIRNKTIPIKIQFTGKQLSETKGRVEGSTTLKRTAFGVGQGEWAETNTIKDEVKVSFVITAEKK